MDSTEHPPSAVDAIESVAFKVSLKGYNVDEVDDFLERLSSEVRQMRDLIAQQRQQLRQASERISQLDSRPSTAPTPISAAAPVATSTARSGGADQVASMIQMAQQFIEGAQHEAQAKARELTAAAQERAREIVTEARSRAEDEVTRLNGLKQRLSEDVESLHHQLESERNRLREVLTDLARRVEQTIRLDGHDRPSSPHAVPEASAPESATHSARPVVAGPSPSAGLPPRPSSPPPAPPPSAANVLNFEAPGDSSD